MDSPLVRKSSRICVSLQRLSTTPLPVAALLALQQCCCPAPLEGGRVFVACCPPITFMVPPGPGVPWALNRQLPAPTHSSSPSHQRRATQGENSCSSRQYPPHSWIIPCWFAAVIVQRVLSPAVHNINCSCRLLHAPAAVKEATAVPLCGSALSHILAAQSWGCMGRGVRLAAHEMCTQHTMVCAYGDNALW